MTGRMWRVVIGSAVLGSAAGLVLWFVGMPVLPAVAAAVFAMSVGIGAAGLQDLEPARYRAIRPTPRAGTRSDLIQLAWALRDRSGRVSDTGRKRLQAFARVRLARVGLNLDDPRQHALIAARIGAARAAILTGARAPSLAEAEDCVRDLESIDPVAPPHRAAADTTGRRPR